MSVPVPYSNQGALVDRRVGRALSQIHGHRAIELARIEEAADLQVGRIEAVVHVGRTGMQAVALLSQLEGQLAQLVPLATSRLQALGDISALAVAEVVSDTVRKVR